MSYFKSYIFTREIRYLFPQMFFFIFCWHFFSLFLNNELIYYYIISDLTSAVKWEGTLSSPFVIKQGVRQGGVLSTGHYKRYNHQLLIEIENKFTGAKIGYIRVPHVTVADDVALLTNLASEMQVMLPCTGSFANIARFVIHPNISCILIFWENTLNLSVPHLL